MDMMIVLKSLNEMQQITSMRLTNLQHDISLYTLLTFKCITI